MNRKFILGFADHRRRNWSEDSLHDRQMFQVVVSLTDNRRAMYTDRLRAICLSILAANDVDPKGFDKTALTEWESRLLTAHHHIQAI